MQEHGFSKRKAEKAVNAVFSCMARALRRGEEVELPVGWIQTAWEKRGERKWQRFRNIQNGKKIFYKLVRRRGIIIRFRPDPEQIVRGPEALTPPAPPAAPEPATPQEAAEQSFIWLMGRKPCGSEMGHLLECAGNDWNRLRARLRYLVDDGNRCGDYYALCTRVRQLTWIG
jgi:nucleoid DNA-binding protein